MGQVRYFQISQALAGRFLEPSKNINARYQTEMNYESAYAKRKNCVD